MPEPGIVSPTGSAGEDGGFPMIDPKHLPSIPLSGEMELPDSAGVYFALKGDEVLYIGRSFIEEIKQEQLSELRQQLHAIGFSTRAITAAFRDLEWKEA